MLFLASYGELQQTTFPTELRKQVETYLTETDWAEWENGEDLFNDSQDAVYKSIVGMARNMRARGMSSQEIAEITGLSDLEIAEL